MRVEISLLFLISVCLLPPLQTRAESEIPHPGPRTAEEPAFLWKEGSEALDSKDFPTAIRDLKRLIARYPDDSRITDARLSLSQALIAVQNDAEALETAKALILSKPGFAAINRARAYVAESHLHLKNFLEARTAATELLENSPTLKQKALSYSIRFQTYLEEKQYPEARAELDLLRDLMEKEPVDSYVRLLPEFKMNFTTRQCNVSHLLKDKVITDDEFLDYFSNKNNCFKTALPAAHSVTGTPVLREWCESFTFFNHELEKRRLDPFLKDKIGKDLKATLEFAKGVDPELVKCYVPYKIPKSKKRHRRSSHPPSH